MNWNTFTLWFGKQDSKGKSRIIAGSGVAVAVIFYLTSSLYTGFSAWSELNAKSEEATNTISMANVIPSFRTPSTTPARSYHPISTAGNEKQPSVSVREELENANASRAFRDQVLGDAELRNSNSNSWRTIADSSKVGATRIREMEFSAPAPPSLEDVSYVGWYSLTGRGGEAFSREKVEMTFTRFDPDRRVVEVKFRSLDNLEWGVVTYLGTFQPSTGSIFDIIVDKQNVGTRDIRCGVADLFGPYLNWYGREAQFSLRIDGDTITGNSKDGHGGSKFESLILTRISRDEVERPIGPDSDLFRKDESEATKSDAVDMSVDSKMEEV